MAEELWHEKAEVAVFAFNALNDRLLAGLDELGGIVVTPREVERRGALVCVRSTDAPRLVAELGRASIVTSERDGNLRVSLHAYNVDEDVDAVLAALDDRRHLLARAGSDIL